MSWEGMKMGGKSRKTGGVSKALIDRIKREMPKGKLGKESNDGGNKRNEDTTARGYGFLSADDGDGN